MRAFPAPLPDAYAGGPAPAADRLRSGGESGAPIATAAAHPAAAGGQSCTAVHGQLGV